MRYLFPCPRSGNDHASVPGTMSSKRIVQLRQSNFLVAPDDIDLSVIIEQYREVVKTSLHASDPWPTRTTSGVMLRGLAIHIAEIGKRPVVIAKRRRPMTPAVDGFATLERPRRPQVEPFTGVRDEAPVHEVLEWHREAWHGVHRGTGHEEASSPTRMRSGSRTRRRTADCRRCCCLLSAVQLRFAERAVTASIASTSIKQGFMKEPSAVASAHTNQFLRDERCHSLYSAPSSRIFICALRLAHAKVLTCSIPVRPRLPASA